MMCGFGSTKPIISSHHSKDKLSSNNVQATTDRRESIKLRALQFSFSISPRCYKALISTHISYSALNFSHPMTTHQHPATRCHFPSLSSLTHRPLWCGERKEKPTPSIHFIITNGLHSPGPAATSLFHTECMHACTWPLLCLSCRNTCLHAEICVCVYVWIDRYKKKLKNTWIYLIFESLEPWFCMCTRVWRS